MLRTGSDDTWAWMYLVGQFSHERQCSVASHERNNVVRVIFPWDIKVTRMRATIRWNRILSVFHSHWKVFPSGKRIGWKMILQPISKCYHKSLHAGTGNPELTIGPLTNQKILKYHQHVTNIIHERKNDKWIIKRQDRTKGEKPWLNNVTKVPWIKYTYTTFSVIPYFNKS